MRSKKSLRSHRERQGERWVDCYEFCQWSLGSKTPRGYRGVTFDEYVRKVAWDGGVHGFQIV
jgi:hypothetical protein